MAADDLETLTFASQPEFERWLEKEHLSSPGLWLRIAKKASGIATVTYAEALEVALCFGWIDGQRRGVDETYFVQRFTPRRKRSIWSKINTEKVTGLIAQGRMRPAGQEQIDLAKADGRWDAAYSGPRTAEVPPEIEKDPVASKALEAMSKTNRFAYIHRFNHAKRPETREKLIQQLREGHQFH
jgi:uncharacterized protein YdeI (YjbR/CyaY-like superfamily)